MPPREFATPVSRAQHCAAFEERRGFSGTAEPCRVRRTIGHHAGHHSVARRHIRALEEQWDDVPRRSLEAIAVEAYRTGALTESQVRRLLGLDSRFQVHALLKEHHVPLQYTAADLEDDLRAQRDLGILPRR